MCPSCKQEVEPKKPVVLLSGSFSSKEALSGASVGISAFLCQCGAIFSPMTTEARAEWMRRFGAKPT